jgi:hypothetical protein
MMDENKISPILQHFTGNVVEAQYLPSPIPGYQENPLIEALPPILTAANTIEELRYEPAHDEATRLLPTELRLHLLYDALNFFKPLPVHVELEQRISRVIRAGYQGRNPLVRGFRRQMETRLQEETTRRLNHTRSQGFTLLGVSGVGKTTALEGILSLYPQVIAHSSYQGQPFSHLQVVWLKLDCPHDGSIRGLCLNFFQAMDGLLDTGYFCYHARRGRATTDEMLPAMARVSAIHSLGVLVIDEIQHLSESRSGGANRMLNFFVHLVNTIGMPVILVGTPKARAVLTGEFRQARRGAGQGDLVWNQMRPDVIWDLFIQSLWQYQFTHQESLLTPELNQALYDETQGIVDLAVKVYMLAQFRAMTTGRECVTETLIRSVAADSLQLARPMLAALRSGDLFKLSQFEDIQPLDMEFHLQTALTQTVQQPANPAPSPESAEKPKPVRTSPAASTPSGLLAASRRAREADQPLYDLLQATGYLRDAHEYLTEVAL